MKNTKKSKLKSTQVTLPNRLDKTLSWLEASRDTWKKKCLLTKLELKKRTLSVKRLIDARNIWKGLSKAKTLLIQELQNERESYFKEIEKLKKELASKNTEIDILKKKSSFHSRN